MPIKKATQPRPMKEPVAPTSMPPGSPEMSNWMMETVFNALITGGTRQMRDQLQIVASQAVMGALEWKQYRADMEKYSKRRTP